MFNKIKIILNTYRARINYRNKISKYCDSKDKALKDCFINNTNYSTKYRKLIDYFTNSYTINIKDNFTRGYFEGEFSYHGADIDAIEGASRFMPFIATVVAFESSNLNRNELLQALKAAFIEGTDPDSEFYFGELTDYSQLICEAADIALALWIARDSLWSLFTKSEQVKILNWLKQAESKKIVDNNWHLFILTINVVVNYFDESHQVLATHLERVKEFYLGDGWFQDGIGGSVDYYNAWAFQYSLYWISVINPKLDNGYFFSINAIFCDKYQYFFTSNGYPFFGRSISYRMAAPCPLIISSLLTSDVKKFQKTRMIFDNTWKYFIVNDGVKGGLPTQGYFKSNSLMVDEYSGPASSLWGLRSLILMITAENKFNCAAVESRLLPCELNDFKFNIPAINLTIQGVAEGQVVNAVWEDRKETEPAWEPFTIMKQVKQALSQKPQRPKNGVVKNTLAKYTSDYETSFLNIK